MSYLDHSPDEEPIAATRERGRLPVVVAAVVAALAILAGAWWLLRPSPPSPAPESARAEPARAPSAPAARAEPAPAPPAAAPAPRARTRSVPKAAPEAPPPPEAAPAPTHELLVDADVPGALVFLDRQFLGNAPVRTSEITPGTHQLNVSAEGFDGIARTIEVAAEGPTEILVRFNEVRLSEGVDVVHKHGMGSCQGRLTADLQGFRYAPQRGDDAFTLPLDAVESFEIDYMKKNLRLKRKGGRTWNFESPTGSADPLFVFHRDVEKARARLAAQR
jgi:hypothetical protein